MIEDRDSPPPYQGESRSRSSNHSSKRHHTASGSVWGGSPHKICLSLVVDWLKTVAVQWLLAMFIVDIKCTDRTPTDRQKCSCPSRFGPVLSRLRAGRTRRSAGCARLCAGYYGRAPAGTGASWHTTGYPPPHGGLRPCHHVV